MFFLLTVDVTDVCPATSGPSESFHCDKSKPSVIVILLLQCLERLQRVVEEMSAAPRGVTPLSGPQCRPVVAVRLRAADSLWDYLYRASGGGGAPSQFP